MFNFLLYLSLSELEWTVDPAADGRCILKVFEGGNNDYLGVKSDYIHGQENFTVSTGGTTGFEWNLESIGPGRLGSELAYA